MKKQIFTFFTISLIIAFSIIGKTALSQSYCSINIENNTTDMISGTLSSNNWIVISTFSALALNDWSLTSNELIPTANAAGTYLIKYSASFTGSVGVYTVGVFKNDVFLTDLQSSRKISSAGGADYGNISGNGFITISGTSDKISLKIMCDSDVTDITPKSAQLSLVETVAGSGNHYAEMSIINNSTEQDLAVSGAFYTLDGFVSGELDGWTRSGNTLVAGAGSAGTYFVSACCSYKANTAGSYDFRIDNDGGVPTGISFGRYLSGTEDYGNAVGSGVITVVAGDILSLETRCTSSSTVKIEPVYVGFTMTEISGTTPCYVANMDIIEGDNILEMVNGSWVQETHFDEGSVNQGWSFSPFPNGTLAQNDNTTANYLVNYNVSFSYKDGEETGYVFPKMAIFIGTTQVEGSTIIRKLQRKDQGDVASASGTAIIPISSSSQVISLKAIEKDNANKSISIIDANITIMSITGVDQSNMVVKGNSNTIEAGSTQPEADNNTYFGFVALNSSLDKNFQIYNDGNIDLTGISASLSGTDASEFKITTIPSETVTSGSSTNLGVQFTPTSEGSKYATVSIASNDPDNNPFTFVIMGSTSGVKVWNGSTSTAWETDANWTLSGASTLAPTISDDIRIPSSPTNKPVISPTSTGQCGNIFIEDGASVTIQSTSAGTGSLIINGEQTGDLTIQRYLAINHYHYISSPIDYSNEMLHFEDIYATVTSGDELNMGLTINGDDNFWRFIEEVAVGDGIWIDLLHTWSGHPTSRMALEMFRPAEGYAYCSYSSAATLKFEGVANTSDISYAVTYTDNGGDNGCHVIGNPFTSDIAVTDDGDATNNFINDNTALLDDNYEALYIWNEGSGTAWTSHYQAISNSGFVPGSSANAMIDQDFIELGQAFMVKVSSAGNIAFNKDTRKHGIADFYKKSAESWPGVLLTIKEQGEEMNDQSSTAITFYEGMTTSLDPSYDVGILKNDHLSLYSRLAEDNLVDFETQALPKDFTNDVIIPIGVDASECTTFEFTALTEEMGNYEMVLEDKLTDQLISLDDLSQEGYNVTLTENGIGRFFIHIKNVSAVGENENSGINIYAYDKTVYVSSNGIDNQELFIYDISGRVLQTEQISKGLEVIETKLPAGVYFVKTGGFTQKVVLL